jgi:H+/Cl- antiporter ClcA
MSAAYGVPLGGSLFSLEVMRGLLALRYVLPALAASAVATGVAWIVLPDKPTYVLPAYASSAIAIPFAMILGPIAGLYSVAYVRLITWAERHKPEGWRRMTAPILCLALLGAISVRYPQLLGNGKDVSQLAFSNLLAPGIALTLLVLKPAAITLCIGSGAPGGLFTPSLTSGAMLGATVGHGFAQIAPAFPNGLAALLGAAAVLASTTQGPVSAVVLLMELTGHDRSIALPMIIAASLATLVSRTIDARSVYDARLSDEQIQARQRMRDSGLPLSDANAAQPRRDL